MIAAIFLKAPVPGTVKTRLAASIGNDAACQAYRVLVAHQLERIPSSWETVVFFSPADAENDFRSWLGLETRLVAQCAGDLGARQSAALRMLSSHSALCLIGADCPYLDQLKLAGLADDLIANDLAMIPATDGGYVALAVRAGMPAASIDFLFKNIDWGSGTVGIDLIKNAENLALRYALRPPLEDVDTLDAWRRAENFLRSS